MTGAGFWGEATDEITTPSCKPLFMAYNRGKIASPFLPASAIVTAVPK
jgi:hypothetical protein